MSVQERQLHQEIISPLMEPRASLLTLQQPGPRHCCRPINPTHALKF